MRHELELKMQSFARNLDLNNFKALYLEYIDKYGIPKSCFFSEIFFNYPEIICLEFSNEIIIEKKKKITKIINDFIDFLRTQDFTFKDSLINKYNDEITNFFDLYETIGLDYQNSHSGNTILHNQILGLNLDGVELLISNESELLSIENYKGFCPTQTLFLENSISYSFDGAKEKKEKILNEIKNNDDLNKEIYKFNKKENLLHRTLKHQIFVENLIKIDDIDVIIKVFNLNKLHLHLNLNFILEFLDNDNIQKQNFNYFLKHYDVAI